MTDEASYSEKKEYIKQWLREKWNYEVLIGAINNTYVIPEIQQIGKQLVDKSVELIAEDYVSEREQIVLGDKVLAREDVLVEYEKIDMYIMLTLIDKVIPRICKIKNVDRYMHIALITAAREHEGESYYKKQEQEYEEPEEITEDVYDPYEMSAEDYMEV
jgi:hypothetical protein